MLFVPRQKYRRKLLHDLFGGQRRGGTSTPAKHPVIFIFTGQGGGARGIRGADALRGREGGARSRRGRAGKKDIPLHPDAAREGGLLPAALSRFSPGVEPSRILGIPESYAQSTHRVGSLGIFPRHGLTWMKSQIGDPYLSRT